MHKKAQVATGIGLYVITIIIILILGIFIYVSSYAGIFERELRFIPGPEPLVTKSISAYLLSEDCQGNMAQTTFESLVESNDISDCEKEKAKNILDYFYGKSGGFVGIDTFSRFGEMVNPLVKRDGNTESYYTDVFRINDKYFLYVTGNKNE